jgi:hypothetical protein
MLRGGHTRAGSKSAPADGSIGMARVQSSRPSLQDERIESLRTKPSQPWILARKSRRGLQRESKRWSLLSFKMTILRKRLERRKQDETKKAQRIGGSTTRTKLLNSEYFVCVLTEDLVVKTWSDFHPKGSLRSPYQWDATLWKIVSKDTCAWNCRGTVQTTFIDEEKVTAFTAPMRRLPPSKLHAGHFLETYYTNSLRCWTKGDCVHRTNETPPSLKITCWKFLRQIRQILCKFIA